MPLLDHFHPPIVDEYEWESFHANWATKIADRLNLAALPPGFLAEEYQVGKRHEIDIATTERSPSLRNGTTGGTAVAVKTSTYAPPAAKCRFATSIPPGYSVRVYQRSGGKKLVAAIEIVSTGSKDRPAHRRSFIAKCAALISQGVAVSVIDIVSSYRANLHNLLMKFTKAPADSVLDPPTGLYVSSYRPANQGKKTVLDVWVEPLALATELPTMPLRIVGDVFAPIEYELTYLQSCRSKLML